MPGDETKNFDMLIELSEEGINRILGVFLDSDSFLCERILREIGLGSLCDLFTIDVSLDRPDDPRIPDDATDIIDVSILLGEGGRAGVLRLVASLDVRRTDEFDLVGIDMADQLHVAEITDLIIPIPGISALFESALRSIEFIPLVPIPVHRATTEPGDIQQADANVVDRAVAVMLTFGGGGPGNADALTTSIVPPGQRAAMAIFFGWLCRIISPRIQSSLELPDGAFVSCRLNQTVRVDEEREVDLTTLELGLRDRFIEVTAAVRKSGFCYEATGRVTARVRMEVVDGRLIVDTEIDDPQIDIDHPWYCWLALGLTGAAIGSVLSGIIGSVVGAIMAPLILWVAGEVIEGTVEAVAARVANALSRLDLDVPAVGINLLFDRVFIDDITIAAELKVLEKVPIRSEGVLIVRNGELADLDTGTVGGGDLPGADLEWTGRGYQRRLRVRCGAELARTDRRDFDDVVRFQLYGLSYDAPEAVPVTELAVIVPFAGLLGVDEYTETHQVYGVRTNEGRFAIIQVIDVEESLIRLRYRTYDREQSRVQIVGDFRCERLGPAVNLPRGAIVSFEPSPVLEAACPPVSPALLEARLRTEGRVGRWKARYAMARSNVARFRAVTDGFRGGEAYYWQIAGVDIEADSGSIDVQGDTLQFLQRGAELVVYFDATRDREFLVRVMVVDETGHMATASRCIAYTDVCEDTVRYIPSWSRYRDVYLEHFGVAVVPPGIKALAPQGAGGHRRVKR